MINTQMTKKSSKVNMSITINDINKLSEKKSLTDDEKSLMDAVCVKLKEIEGLLIGTESSNNCNTVSLNKQTKQVHAVFQKCSNDSEWMQMADKVCQTLSAKFKEIVGQVSKLKEEQYGMPSKSVSSVSFLRF